MKTLGLIFCCLVFAAAAFAVSGPSQPFVRGNGNDGSLDTRWGPDTYGYTARDTLEADGPHRGWMDISATGTPVTGLADDNVVGPFPIGFAFHYYWYDVTQFWIGSNGYIKFSSAGQLAQPIPTFPTATAPNDIIGPYVADWILGGTEPGRCYYETRGTDSLIVMWKNIRAWGTGGNVGDHNFELILSRLDSSITFEYGTMTTGDVSNTSISVGMENVTGQIGISCYHNAYPPQNNAIKFYYPASTTYVAHDMAVGAVQNPISGGFFMLVGDTLHPWLSAHNVGNQNEATFRAVYSVRSNSNTLLAAADSTVGPLAPSAFLNIQYPPLWVAGATNVYKIMGRVNMTGDINHTNDSTQVQLHTLTLPGELYYDDNGDEQDWSWDGGNGGMANQFVPPVYPVRITHVRYYLGAATAGFTARIFADSAGAPGRQLWSQDVPTPTANAWNDFTLTDTVRIDSGAFYVAWTQTAAGATFGIDTTTTQGVSRRTWEFAGGWAEFREGQVANAMIRCTIASGAPDRPPVISAHTPTTLDTAYQDSTYHFTVTASDPDNDSLRYRWTRNGSLVGNNSSANILFPSLGATVVKCVVSDGQLADSVMWNVMVVETPNAVGDPTSTLPVSFALRAAYPNPFNPSTSLSYDIAREGDVTLKIYDVLGNEVTTLINTRLAAGRYTAQWNASANASGTYFAVLQAKDVRLMQKLLLMK
ncbi:MAG TPA: T9SS type A sorting domain-containing protein [bacterium]